ncbi:MAG: N-acetyltransferase, partial [Clostridiales bacterium]|nr:N-acetyltransferase [Clostridiales bacterium]
MKLRRLELKDKKLMLEWMHDFNVVQNMRTDFCNKTEEDCEAFIQSSWENTGDLHLAIVDESDMYLGTVS